MRLFSQPTTTTAGAVLLAASITPFPTPMRHMPPPRMSGTGLLLEDTLVLRVSLPGITSFDQIELSASSTSVEVAAALPAALAALPAAVAAVAAGLVVAIHRRKCSTCPSKRSRRRRMSARTNFAQRRRSLRRWCSRPHSRRRRWHRRPPRRSSPRMKAASMAARAHSCPSGACGECSSEPWGRA